MDGIVKGEAIKPYGPWEWVKMAGGVGLLLFLALFIWGALAPMTDEDRARWAEHEHIERVCERQHDELQELRVRREARASCKVLKLAFEDKWGRSY